MTNDMSDAKTDIIDWDWFDSLSESEQNEEKQTWGDRQWLEYLMRGHKIITKEEFIERACEMITEALKEQEESLKTENTYSNYKPYQAENDMELFEYHLLERQQTHLPMRIYVDDGGAYLRHDHPLWLYMCNGYQTDSPVIPVTISEAPCIPLDHYDLNVSESHLEKVYIFIKENYNILLDLANDKILNVDFDKIVKPIDDVTETIRTLTPRFCSFDDLPSEKAKEIQALKDRGLQRMANHRFNIRGIDNPAWHLWLEDENGGVMTYLDISPEEDGVVTFGSMVSEEKRHGAWYELVQTAIHFAFDYLKATTIEFDARTYSVKFYRRFGFKEVSEEFVVDGISYIKMRLTRE